MSRLPRALVLVRREFLASVRTKSYVLGTLFGPALILLVIVMPALFAQLGDAPRIVVVDVGDTGLGAQAAAALRSEDRYRVELVTPDAGSADSARAALRARIAAEEIDGLVWVDPDVVGGGTVRYEGTHAASSRVLRQIRGAVTPAVQAERLRAAGIDPGVLGEALRPVEIEARGVRPERDADASADAMEAAMAVSFALYMLILLYGMSVLRGIREEKENRVVELILSSVRPEQLMVGKVVGIGAAGLLQVTIWVAFAGLLLGFGDRLAAAVGLALPDLPSVPWSLGVIFLGCFLGGYFLYAAIYAAVGATAGSGQDAQNVQMIATAPLMIAFFSLFAVIENPTGTVATICSLVPLSSPLVLPPRLALVPVPAWELAAALAILAGSCLALLWVGGKVYRVTILATGQRPTVRQLWRWVRAA